VYQRFTNLQNNNSFQHFETFQYKLVGHFNSPSPELIINPLAHPELMMMFPLNCDTCWGPSKRTQPVSCRARRRQVGYRWPRSHHVYPPLEGSFCCCHLLLFISQLGSFILLWIFYKIFSNKTFFYFFFILSSKKYWNR